MSVKMKTPSVKMKASSAMKDSGIAWVGEIPEHWDTIPNKHVMKKKKVICDKYNNEDILSLTMSGVIIRDFTTGGKIPASFDGYQRVYRNNLLMCLFDYDVTPRCIGLIENNGITSPAYSQFEMKQGNLSEYYYYYYLMVDNTKALLHLAKNLRHSFTEEQLGNIKVPYPPIEEQRLIAVQLNQICGTLDNTKADIEKQIEILNEYKKSVITEVVTKGLDKNVELKDSGIDWIGKIPEHWDFSRIKYFCTIGSGTDPITESGDTPVYGSGSKSFKTCEEYKIGPTVLLGRKGTINIPQWVEGNYWNVDTAFDVKSKGNFSLRLFYYISICLDYDRYNMQTTVPSMAKGDYENMYIPIPPINEQQEIVAYLDSKCSEIDSIIETKKHQLELLEEYKKSIIYEYVTGKREVSALLDGVTAPLDEVSAKPDFAVAPDNQSVSIE